MLETLSGDSGKTGGSNYVWENIRAARSLSTLSVMTAEPIDYDCTKEIDFSKFLILYIPESGSKLASLQSSTCLNPL